MSIEYIIALVTVIVEIILGFIAKKNPKIKNQLIPVQNLLVGLVVAIIEYIITKDFEAAIAISGLIAGGTYDIVHNLRKMKGEQDGDIRY